MYVCVRGVVGWDGSHVTTTFCMYPIHTELQRLYTIPRMLKQECCMFCMFHKDCTILQWKWQPLRFNVFILFIFFIQSVSQG